MGKGTGTIKWSLVGALSATAIASALYILVPNNEVIESKTIEVKSGEYSKTIYGVPEFDLNHYRLTEDDYFKYLVDGTLNVGRENPAAYPLWYSRAMNDPTILLENVELREKVFASVKGKKHGEELAKAVEDLIKNSTTGEPVEGKVLLTDEEKSGLTKVLRQLGKEIAVELPPEDEENTEVEEKETNKPVEENKDSKEESPSKDNVTITKEDFDKIEDGMSYKEVSSILGEGKELSSSDIAGNKTVMYQWTGENYFSGMTVMLTNDKVISKSIIDLNSSKGNNTATKAKYDSVQLGITYEQLKEIMGSDGALVGDSSSGDYSLKIYQWYGQDNEFSNATFSFDSTGKLSNKNQIGLN